MVFSIIRISFLNTRKKPLGADASHNTGAPPQTPPLRAGYSSILLARAALAPDALLSGQKSALERIQATDFICPFAKSSLVPPKRHKEISNFTKRSGCATLIVPKVRVTSTAAWDGWGRAHPGALAGTSRIIQSL